MNSLVLAHNNALIPGYLGLALGLVIGVVALWVFIKYAQRQLPDPKLVETSSDGIWDWCVKTNNVWFSARYWELLGYGPGDPLPPQTYDGWYAQLHPDDIPIMQQTLDRHFDQGEPFNIEYRMRTKSGAYHWFKVQGQVQRNAQGNPVRMTGNLQDVQSLKTTEAELQKIACIDNLTGLGNRAALIHQLNRAIKDNSKHEGCRFALLSLDFDRFKTINDSHGHNTGDALLCQIAKRLKKELQPSVRVATAFTIGRFGSDEFAILAEPIRYPELADSLAERVLSVISEPYHLNGEMINLTASIGIACSNGSYQSAEEILRDADTAMHEAKARGKACVVRFDLAMRLAIENRRKLEAELQNAIADKQFFLMYQPIVSLEDGGIRSVESLIRWNHPTHGTVPPNLFIPLAEETRMILPMSEWILEESCRQFIAWKRSGIEACPKYISVNLSRVQLTEPDLDKRVLQTLRDAGMQPEELQLEVTESEVMRDPEGAKKLLKKLKVAGIRLAMDDFGTGYSSLSCLHEFSFDVLKIDRSFVNRLHEGRIEFTSLIHAVVNLASNLGMTCVAEGVESRDQIAVLQSIDCEFAQGFYFAKPLSADRIATGQWQESDAKQDRCA